MVLFQRSKLQVRIYLLSGFSSSLYKFVWYRNYPSAFLYYWLPLQLNDALFTTTTTLMNLHKFQKKYKWIVCVFFDLWREMGGLHNQNVQHFIPLSYLYLDWVNSVHFWRWLAQSLEKNKINHTFGQLVSNSIVSAIFFISISHLPLFMNWMGLKAVAVPGYLLVWMGFRVCSSFAPGFSFSTQRF